MSGQALTKMTIQLVQEIETQALVAQQQIGLARGQMASKQREQRLVKLTLSEMASLPDDAVVYEGVGKMCVFLPLSSPPPSLLWNGHFIVLPPAGDESDGDLHVGDAR
jgi:hypothetical protein